MKCTVKNLTAGLLGVVLFLPAGCTPDAYKRSADLQVRDLLRDRKQQTLGYQPEVEAEPQASAKPVAKSYSKVPASPLPPPPVASLEPVRREPTWERLGPFELLPGEVEPESEITFESVSRPIRLKLQLGPPERLEPIRTLDLFQSIEYAVQHSRTYQTRMEDLYLAALNVTLERHLFSPRPFVRTGLTYDGGQQDVDYRSALTASTSAGIRQQLPYGGEIVASTLVSFVNALNGNVTDGENAVLALSGTVPLLRGAGMVNLEPLIQSERSLVYEVRSFERFRRDFVVDLASQYFRLLTRQQAIANRRANYLSLADLTERTQALYAAGRLNFLQVQRSLQQQLSAENALVNAQAAYESALDDFKITLGIPVEEPLDIVPVALDVDVPDLNRIDPLELALIYRLDLTTAADQVEDARRNVQVAKNGLLPELNLTADASVGNRAGTAARSIDSRDLQYSAGVTLDLPVDRVAERNSYRRSLITLDRAQRSFDLTRDNILADVRSAIRGIRSAELSVQIQRRAVDLAQRRLEYSNELLLQGRSSDSRDVTEAQSSLLSAQDSLDSAQADLQIQVLQFLRDTGTLRVDPKAGALGHALDRAEARRHAESPDEPLGPNPLGQQVR